MKSLAELLNTTSVLKPLYDKANELLSLNLIWRLALPDLANFCKIANFEAGELVLEINKSAFATRVRFELPEIKKKILEFPEFSSLHTIRYKIILYPPSSM